MGIGLSGMISGLDTDSIVKAMVSGQQAKATKIENKITLNKWTKEAWSGLNTKIYSFYTKYASKLRLQTSYMTRTASSSNESVVKATASSSSALGTHSLEVRKLASSQYVTGGQLKKKDENGKPTDEKAEYNKNSKLTEMGVKAGTIVTITAGTEDPKEIKLEVTADTTVNDFLTACKDAGLTASFDTDQQRFFISSSESGAENAFTITTSELSDNASKQFTELEKMIDTSVLSSSEKTAYDEAMATLRKNVNLIDDVLTSYNESDKTQKAVLDAINVVKDAAEKKYANETANTEENDKITTLLTDVQDKDAVLTYGDTEYTYNTLEAVAKENIEADCKNKAATVAKQAVEKKVTELDIKLEGNYINPADLTIEKKLAADELIADKQIEEANIDKAVEDQIITEEVAASLKEAYAVVNTWNYDLDGDGDGTTTLGELYDTTYDTTYNTEKAEVDTDDDGIIDNATAIEAEMKAVLKAEQEDTYNANVATRTAEILAAEDNADIVTIKSNLETILKSAANSGSTTSSSGLSAMGLGEVGNTAVSEQDATNTTGMVVIAASDAEFVLDGATMTETSNSFTVNGLTLNLSGTTKNASGGYDTVQVTVGKDVDSTYKLIKEALTEYNKLIEEMNTLYNADSARGYDPLTDEQKESMSETDIENWEKKIKDSLLRRDDTLGSLLTSMRNALSTSYTDEDGKVYSLSSYGIVTGHYTEKGKLHIYGDEDDPTYATYSDRLKTALEEDPDKVMEVMTKVFGNLYETMTEKCAKTEISSALTFYNDKQYDTLLEDYEDDLDILEDRIAELEDRYYKQFTAMETALSKLQNQSSSLASLLGTGTGA